MSETNIIDRVYNIMKVDKDNISLPTSMKLELSAICNHKCSYCVVPHLKTKEHFMSEMVFYKAIKEAERLGIKELGLFHMGEGTLHPVFCKMVEEIPDNFDIFITTNGTQYDKMEYLVDRCVKSIKVSLNGYNKEKHKEVTGVDTFDLIIGNLKKLVKHRNEVHSPTQISASSIFYNCKEQEEFAKMIESIVDCYYYSEIFNHAAKVNNKHIELTDDKRIIKNFNSIPCIGMYNMIHIKPNGDINVCKWGVDDEFVVGNIMTDKIEDIWFSDKVNDLRKKQIEHCLDTCNKCIGISDGL